MTARRRSDRATRVVMGLAMLAVMVLPGCRLLPVGPVAETSSPQASKTSSADDDAGASDAGGAHAASDAGGADAVIAAAGTRCGQRAGWAVVVAQGTLDCSAAMGVIADYEDTREIAPGGRPARAEQIRGWACEPLLFAKMGFEPDTYSSWCARDGAAIITIDAKTVLPVVGPIRKPTDLRLDSAREATGEWGFTSPSGSWYCGLFNAPDDREYPSGVECFSLADAIPGTTADGPDGPNGPATSVALSATGRAATFYSGDTALHYLQQSPPTLEYGEVAYARGAACVVDRTAGVTCTVPRGSFTVSLSGGLTAR